VSGGTGHKESKVNCFLKYFGIMWLPYLHFNGKNFARVGAVTQVNMVNYMWGLLMPDMLMVGPENVITQELSYLLAPNLTEIPRNF
jgi:hypothetical protein